MYERERVIIDIRKYNIDDFFCRYKEGRIVFYERHRITKSQWEKQIPDIMWALKRGIPFPPIYASELQTGEFLIFDKNISPPFFINLLIFIIFYYKIIVKI